VESGFSYTKQNEAVAAFNSYNPGYDKHGTDLAWMDDCNRNQLQIALLLHLFNTPSESNIYVWNHYLAMHVQKSVD
jgi:hypothetical protein